MCMIEPKLKLGVWDIVAREMKAFMYEKGKRKKGKKLPNINY